MRVMTKLTIAVAFVLTAGCSNDGSNGSEGAETVNDDNPFYTESTQPYQLPPFERIDESHFLPAFERTQRQTPKRKVLQKKHIS